MGCDIVTVSTDTQFTHLAWQRSEKELANVKYTMGADPTAETPSADVIGVASQGLLQVITDPRTTLSQSLEAMLTAELTDNDGWETLAALADDLGQTELRVGAIEDEAIVARQCQFQPAAQARSVNGGDGRHR